jgi:hypothetical protein
MDFEYPSMKPLRETATATARATPATVKPVRIGRR